MVVNGMCVARGKKKIGQSTDEIAREHEHAVGGIFWRQIECLRNFRDRSVNPMRAKY
jgi:hypothetical protein